MASDQWFIDGLARRGFCGLDGGFCSKGRCHTPDEKHFILVTDGLVIYSTCWDWNDAKNIPGAIVQEWYWDEFQFEDLDRLLQRGQQQ